MYKGKRERELKRDKRSWCLGVRVGVEKGVLTMHTFVRTSYRDGLRERKRV